MQDRSITKILILNTLTLGFYEVIWLSETRREMVTKYGVQIPSAKVVGVIYWFQWVAVILALVVLGVFLSQNNKLGAERPIVRPSQKCFINYAQTNGPNAALANTLSKQCKSEVDSYFSAQDRRDNQATKTFWYAGAFFALVFAALGSIFVTVRWLKYYAVGVELVTGGRITKGRALQYLSSLPPYVRIFLIQRAFNSSKAPAPTSAQN